MPKVIDLVYIMSPSYSGSTLLTLLLAGHPSISTIGELKATSMGDVDNYFCSCGSKIRQCAFWTRLVKNLADEGVALDLSDLGTHFQAKSFVADHLLRCSLRGSAFEVFRDSATRLLPGAHGRLQAVLQRNLMLVKAIMKIQGGEVFLDASKDPLRLKYLLDSNYWRIRVVYLLRDGRGTTNSFLRHDSISMSAAAQQWQHAQAECARIITSLPGNSWIQIHYEDLCRDPDRVMDVVFGFLGLSCDFDVTAFQAQSHHVLGNQMRLNSAGSISLDQKWKRMLTPSDLAISIITAAFARCAA